MARIEDLIAAVRGRIEFTHKVRAALVSLSLLGYVVLFSSAAALFSPYLAWGLLAVGAAAIAGSSIRMLRGIESGESVCAGIIDSFFSTKDRAISLVELQKGVENQRHLSKQELLKEQIEGHVVRAPLSQIVPLIFSRKEKCLFISALPAYLLAAYLLLQDKPATTIGERGGAVIEQLQEVLQEHPNLPNQLKGDLQEISRAIEEHGLGSNEVESAINQASESLSEAK
ncbi:MAG: hypothetical protein DCC75_13305, partial [Proteobacteria bacterium]